LAVNKKQYFIQIDMIKKLLFSTVLIFSFFGLYAQKKSELISQNQQLKFQLDSINRIISSAERNERIANSKVDEFQKQVAELQDANATLMKNLNSFAALSSQNSENINKTLATLERKEAQLKDITDAVASNDSTAIMVLTQAKKTLGENAKVSVSDGSVVISEKLDFFFSDGLGTEINEKSKLWLENVSKIINANPKSGITIASLTITGEFDLALNQAAVLAGMLIKNHGVNGDRIKATGKDGGLKESIEVIIQPDYKGFYDISKESIKR